MGVKGYGRGDERQKCLNDWSVMMREGCGRRENETLSGYGWLVKSKNDEREGRMWKNKGRVFE